MDIYQEDYNKKCEEKRELINYTAWLQGQYNMASIGAVMSKKCKYPTKPFKIHDDKEETISGEEKFKMWIDEYNKRFEEG